MTPPRCGSGWPPRTRHTRAGARRPPRPGMRGTSASIALMQLPVVMAVQVRGDRLFCLERPAGAEQFLLDPALGDRRRRRAASCCSTRPSAPPTPRTRSTGSTASPDGSLVAVGISEGGTEDSVLRVLDAADGADLGEAIPDTRACSVAWEPDGSRLRLHPLPATATSTTARCTTTASARRWRRRPRRVGRAPRPAGVARRHDLARRRWLLVHVLRRVGARSTSTCSTARPARGRRSIAGDRGRPPASRSPPTGPRWSASPRSTRRRAGSCGSPLDAGRRSGDWDDDRRRGRRRARSARRRRRRAARHRHAAAPSTPSSATRPTARSLGAVDGLGDVVAVAGLSADRDTGDAFVVVDAFDAPTALWRSPSGEATAVRLVDAAAGRRRRADDDRPPGRVPVARRHVDRAVPRSTAPTSRPDPTCR